MDILTHTAKVLERIAATSTSAPSHDKTEIVSVVISHSNRLVSLSSSARLGSEKAVCYHANAAGDLTIVEGSDRTNYEFDAGVDAIVELLRPCGSGLAYP